MSESPWLMKYGSLMMKQLPIGRIDLVSSTEETMVNGGTSSSTSTPLQG